MITLSHVLRLHELSIIDFGGSSGIRDKELLESAVERINATFDSVSLYPSSFEKAAAILESIIKNHPFIDGNKRTGWLACCAVLKYDNYKFSLNQIEAYDFVIKVASSHLEFEEIVTFIESNSVHI